MEIVWATDDEMDEVAHFLARTIALDNNYVSHGEIQTGLSADGRTWVPDLDHKMVEDLRDRGPDREVAIARQGGALIGAIIIVWETTPRIAFMVIEDMAVSRAARGTGVGLDLMAFAERAGRARGMAWAFLESGLGNHHAHEFFEKRGFQPISKVFAKRIDDSA